MEKGTVKFFNQTKGFGFIKVDGRIYLTAIECTCYPDRLSILYQVFGMVEVDLKSQSLFAVKEIA